MTHTGKDLLDALGIVRPVFWTCDDNKKRANPAFELKGKEYPDTEKAKQAGMGLYFLVNEAGTIENEKGNLRHAGNILRPLACFADFDHGTHEEQIQKIIESPIPPSAWVKSGHGYHVYWFLSDTTQTDLPRWTALQKAIAHHFGSDMSVHDPARIMRLPGSWHCKDADPKLVTLERIDATLRYSLDEIAQEFPALPEKSPFGVSDVERLLNNPTGEGGRFQAAQKVIGALLTRFKPPEWETHAWPLVRNWNATECKPPKEEHLLRSYFDGLAKLELQKRFHESTGLVTFREGDLQPHVREDGETVVVSIKVEDGIAQFSFWNTEQTKQDTLNTMISVELQIPGSHPKPYTMRVNLFSHSAMESLSRSLTKSLGGTLKWEHLLNTAQTALVRYLSERDTSTDLAAVPDEESPMLFAPFLVKDGANLLFGDGGTGKTFFCLRLALSLATGKPFLGYTPQEAVPTLFVDYEDNERTASFRLSRLCADPALGLNPITAKMCFRYVNPQGAPIYTIVPALKKIIRDHNIGLVLIDSVASACGAEPEKAESAALYYNALKALGVTSLSIAHVVKTEGSKQDKAFGSVFWHNLARNTWNLQGEEDPEVGVGTLGSVLGEKSKQLGLFHRKFNGGAKSPPIHMRIVYGVKDVRFEEGKPDFWNKDKKVEDRILGALGAKEGGLTLKELTEDLMDVPQKTIRNILPVLRRAGQVEKVGEHGGRYKVQKNLRAIPRANYHGEPSE